MKGKKKLWFDVPTLNNSDDNGILKAIHRLNRQLSHVFLPQHENCLQNVPREEEGIRTSKDESGK